uniref:Uncharacterized protein n=1 Tax=Arundo donax TaxID=35708 RepID=A0A0A9CPK9_ARUDO
MMGVRGFSFKLCRQISLSLLLVLKSFIVYLHELYHADPCEVNINYSPFKIFADSIHFLMCYLDFSYLHKHGKFFM